MALYIFCEIVPIINRVFPVTPNGCITRLSDGGLTPRVQSPSIEPSLAQSNELTMSHNRGIYSSVTLTIAQPQPHTIALAELVTVFRKVDTYLHCFMFYTQSVPKVPTVTFDTLRR